MQPKLAVITVTGCHLIPVICVRRELADLEHDAPSGLANHRVPVMTSHAPDGKPENKDLDGWVAAFTDDGKIKRLDCYPEGSVILTQLGVIGNLSAALEH